MKRKDYELQSLDDYITDVALNRTLADVMQLRTNAQTARSAFVATTICNAIFDMDIGLVTEIVKRIDGLAPAKGDMDGYLSLIHI